MGCPHKIKIRAGPVLPPAQRRPGPAPDSWGGQSRAATPFACGAGTLWRGIARGSRMLSRLAQPLRPWPVPESEKYQKPPKYHFLRFETAPHNYPTHRRQPTGGRARHSVRAAIDIQAGKLSQRPLSQCSPLKKQIMQAPVFTTGYARRQRLPFIRPRRPWLPSPRRCGADGEIQRHLFSEFAAAGPLETAALRQNGYSTLSGFKPQESRSDTGY